MNGAAAQLCADLADRWDLKKRPRSWGGRCPVCGYPGNTFSLKAGKGAHPSAYCSNGCDQAQLDKAIQEALGAAWTGPKRQEPSPEDVAAKRAAKRAVAARLWAGSSSIRLSDSAGLYLAGRGLGNLVACPELRFRPDCRHPEGGVHPALIAQVLDAAGEPIAVHRTFLNRQGGKAAVDPVKASLGPVWGGAVRLAPVAAELVIGEGIETAASAGLMFGLPAWASVSSGNLGGGLVLPPEVRGVVIASDTDTVGRNEAERAAQRWRGEGRRVRIATPDRAGLDFNDLLLERAHAGR